jgi:predicted nucleotidyltransferase component of viral defense system
MDIFKKHEIFEIEVLEKLKNSKFLDPLVFGGGTMLRLCYDLRRYSADLDFWFIKSIQTKKYFNRLMTYLKQLYDVTDAQTKHFTMLFEIRSQDYPKRLKIEIRREVKECDYMDRIAFSKYSTKQVVLRTHTLEQTMQNKVEALSQRQEIRDGFDIEFLMQRGIDLPQLQKNQVLKIKKIVEGFSDKEFKVTLGSVLESEIRNYYINNRLNYLSEKLQNYLTLNF